MGTPMTMETARDKSLFGHLELHASARCTLQLLQPKNLCWIWIIMRETELTAL